MDSKNSTNCGSSNWKQQSSYGSSTWSYDINCAHRLPCGLCKLTMMQCPNFWAYKAKWDTTPVYCSSDGITTGKM